MDASEIFDGYMRAIEGVFEKNETDGMVTIANMSVAYIGTL